MKFKVKQILPPAQYTPEEVQAILDSTDWTDYWQRVQERVEKECDAYREARRKSMEHLTGDTVYD